MNKNITLILVSSLLLAGCSNYSMYNNNLIHEAQVTDTTQASRLLAGLPAPKQSLPVAVYDFQDQTGQFKYNDQFTDYSSAVTKGGLSVLIKALLDTGDGQWFVVAERGGLNDLLKERQIIRTMRSDYIRPDGTKLGNLPPLIYGGMLLEGGIVFYDSNTITGGAAAGYFGLSASTQYHRDIVTVYLRAVNISTGQIILAVNSSKTVFSYAVNAGVTRYLSIDKLLAMETGFSVNEPGQLAVRQAIETALYSLIMEGALRDTWRFADDTAGKEAIAEYLVRRDGKDKTGLSNISTTTSVSSVDSLTHPNQSNAWQITGTNQETVVPLATSPNRSVRSVPSSDALTGEIPESYESRRQASAQQ